METIFYDPKSWASIKEKLKEFYLNHCLPELVEAADWGIRNMLNMNEHDFSKQDHQVSGGDNNQ